MGCLCKSEMGREGVKCSVEFGREKGSDNFETKRGLD